jgi:carbonic anhydrase/acetyltransferase-like protein (isoleucine patch superfamily)
MENIVTYKNKKPEIAKDAYINPFAVVIGDVIIHSGASLWPGVIIRADEESIEVGDNVALLDGVLVEAPQGFPVKIEKNVLVSHNVTLHGCIIEEDVLIGIGANVLEGSLIGQESVIGAGSLIPPGIEVPARSKVSGVPGKICGKVTKHEMKEIRKKHGKIKEKAKDYGSWFVTGHV